MPTREGPFLQTACFCEQVIEDKTGVLSLIRIIDRVTFEAKGTNAPAQMPPLPYSMKLVLTLKAGAARGREEIKIVPEFPDGTAQPATTFSVHFEGDDDRGIHLISPLAFVFPYEGLYWFRIYLDQELLTAIPFRVLYQRIVAGV